MVQVEVRLIMDIEGSDDDKFSKEDLDAYLHYEFGGGSIKIDNPFLTDEFDIWVDWSVDEYEIVEAG